MSNIANLQDYLECLRPSQREIVEILQSIGWCETAIMNHLRLTMDVMGDSYVI